VVGRTVPGLEQHCLRVDDRAGAHMATRHLISLGHRRIAHIGGPASHQDAQDRLAGYRQALGEAGIGGNAALVAEGDYTESSGLAAVQLLMARGAAFSAIFAANDQMAYGARLALYRLGVRVPEDVSLVGFDDLIGSAFTTPPLTTIRQPILEIGRRAAITALRLLDGEPVMQQVLPTELIVRESVAMRRPENNARNPSQG
jgi:LacI family transcriptional regulator